MYVTFDDITELKENEFKLKETKERLELAVNGANIGVWDFNFKTNKLYFNKNLTDLLGYKKNELNNKYDSLTKLIHPKDKRKISMKLDSYLQNERNENVSEFRLKKKSGKWLWVKNISKVVKKDKKGNALRMVGILIDINNQKKDAKKIEYLSFHDELTGLYNRRYFNAEMNKLNKSRKYPISIIIGDINNLKLINDNFGHKMGDRYIKLVGKAFKSALRKEDVTARISGDEFAVILSKTSKKTVRKIGNRIKKELKKINKKNKLPKPISIAIGYNTITSKKERLEHCYDQADKNMYEDKHINKNINS